METNGWFQYTHDGDEPISWISNGGIYDTGCAYSTLGILKPYATTATVGPVYFPLYTYSTNHPVDFIATPMVKLSVSTQGGHVELRDGALRLFVGMPGDHSFAGYYYTRARFAVSGGPGWVTTELELSADQGDWEPWLLAGSHPPSLVDILRGPQQWGFAIFDATSQPTGLLGFDELRVTRKFRTEFWDWAGDTNGWYYFGVEGGQLGSPVGWSEGGGVKDSGYVWTPLDDLRESSMTGTNLFPLIAYGGAKQGRLHPLNLRDRNCVTVFLNPNLPGRPAADLKGGSLNLWVGRWNAPDDHVYYRYTREAFLPGPGGWNPCGIIVSSQTNAWQLIAEVHPASRGATTLTNLLADPQQWGIGLFNASSRPSGRLGFDLLSARQHAENWNHLYDTNGWLYFAKGEPEASNLPIRWSEAAGINDTGFIYAPLDDLAWWVGTGTSRYYPVYTSARHRPVNLIEKRQVTVNLNRNPRWGDELAGTHQADLGGGGLTIFVGWQDPTNNYAYYFFKTNFVLPVYEGWFASRILLTADTNDWVVVESQPDPPGGPRPLPGSVLYSLEATLKTPREWGFAIVEAASQPSGFLGFDDLRIGPDYVMIHRNNDEVMVTFGTSEPDAEPVLYSTEEIIGPWTRMEGATSPLTVKPQVPGAPKRGFWKLVLDWD